MSIRACDGCAACCHHISVHAYGGPIEMDKPGFTPCQHCTGCGLEGSCKVYEIRPEPCRDYQCAWLCNDWIPDELRPDRCGVLFELDATCKEVCYGLTEDLAKLDEPLVNAFIAHMVNRVGLSVFVLSRHGEAAVAFAKGHTWEFIQKRMLAAGMAHTADLERQRAAAQP